MYIPICHMALKIIIPVKKTKKTLLTLTLLDLNLN